MQLLVYMINFLLLLSHGQSAEYRIDPVTSSDISNNSSPSNSLTNSLTRTVFSVSSSSSSIITVPPNDDNVSNINTTSNDSNYDEFETAHKVPGDKVKIDDDDDDDDENSDNVNNQPIIHLLQDVSPSNTISNEIVTSATVLNNNNNNNNKLFYNGVEQQRGTLMQIQKTPNILSTKERPELNPVLSALINEDVMKSIESKRAIEAEQQRQIILETQASANSEVTVTSSEQPPVFILTTTPAPSLNEKARKSAITEDDDLLENSDLIDQSITLEEAGTENNQKSRIQIKKGPNGQEYEYEYVYYYYDDDDNATTNETKSSSETKDEKHIKKPANNKIANDIKEKQKDSSSSSSTHTHTSNRNRTKPQSSQATETLSNSPLKESSSRGKSRYTNIDRSSGTSIPENEIISKAKGRASIPVVEAVDEGRLPQITRFPPRSKNFDATPTPSEFSDSSDISAADISFGTSEKSRKISVKRPSLELVDSETFNTDEKQVKTNRILDNSNDSGNKKSRLDDNKLIATIESSRPTGNTEESQNTEQIKSTSSDSEIDNTTPIMEKVAFDLYAILANENLNMDKTTDIYGDLTTELPHSTDDFGSNSYTTVDGIDSEKLSTPTTSTTVSTTTTTTTTSTTTTEAPTTTTTTTTTTSSPLQSLTGGRIRLSSSGRNRFRLNKSTTTTTEQPTEASTAKGRNRFQRPSFGGRTRTSTPAPSKEEIAIKEDIKPVQSSSLSSRSRTRNRFNIRSTTAAPEKNVDDNSIDEKPSSTTSRTLRGRPTLNIRGRARPTLSTTTTSDEINDNVAVAGDSEKNSDDNRSSAPSLPTRPSRFALNRLAGIQTGANNRLSQRSRLNSLSKTTSDNGNENDDKKHSDNSAAESGDNSSTSTDNSNNNNNGNSNDDKLSNETSDKNHIGGSTLGGLNRLKSRPRINVTAKTVEKPKSQPISLNRKPNPLLARRKIALGGSSTTETEPQEDEAQAAGTSADHSIIESSLDNEEKKSDASDTKDNSASSSSSKDDTTENTETSSEQPRGLGLLGNRRRLPLRKPGTIL